MDMRRTQDLREQITVFINVRTRYSVPKLLWLLAHLRPCCNSVESDLLGGDRIGTRDGRALLEVQIDIGDTNRASDKVCARNFRLRPVGQNCVRRFELRHVDVDAQIMSLAITVVENASNFGTA